MNNTRIIKLIDTAIMEKAILENEKIATEVIQSIAKYLDIGVKIQRAKENGSDYWNDSNIKARDLALSKASRKILYLNTLSKTSGYGYFLKKKINLSSYGDCSELADQVWMVFWNLADKLESMRKVSND